MMPQGIEHLGTMMGERLGRSADFNDAARR
jgi:hypothetical protein